MPFGIAALLGCQGVDLVTPGHGGALLALDVWGCLLYTSDAADERSSVDLGGRRIIKKKSTTKTTEPPHIERLNKKGTAETRNQHSR